MEPVDVYRHYVQGIARDVRVMDLDVQLRYLREREAVVGVFDFCGKIPLVCRLFGDARSVFVVYDECDGLDNAADEHDVIYVLEDVDCVERNVFCRRENAVFLLFDRFRFVRMKCVLQNLPI